VDQRKASQPSPHTSSPDVATSNPDSATSNPNVATSNPVGATSSNPDVASSNPDSATFNPDVATSNPEGNRPEPTMPPLRIDRARARRLRADAQRPLSENLAEGIALSHVLLRYARDTPQR
jgi:hypothetical protein